METNINTNVGTSLETTHTLDFSDRLYKLAIVFMAVAGVAVAGWIFYQFNALPQNAPHEISVSGDGKAFIKPDVAMVSLGVHTQAPKSQDAVNQNNDKMNAVIKAIKDLGVKDEDIQTTSYSLNPVYGSVRGPIPMGMNSAVGAPSFYPYPGIQNTVVAYSLDQQVEVKIRNFDKINDILDKATASGANTVGGLQFTLDNPEVARSQARAKAIEAARQKLQDIAKESGLSVGKLVNVSEGYNNYPQPMYAGAMAKDSLGTTTSPQIQTGQQEVDSTVTLTYQVR